MCHSVLCLGVDIDKKIKEPLEKNIPLPSYILFGGDVIAWSPSLFQDWRN